VADDRQDTLQRASLATEIARVLPGFDRVDYPQWNALFDRFWEDAPAGTVLALDEFPALVAAAREIPSLLQKKLDRNGKKPVHLVLAGSSQEMMQGLVLDRSSPLYGRADEILKIAPLPAGWIQQALSEPDAIRAVEAYAVWGGVPRYWELAREHGSLDVAIREVILSPLGVLHDEPVRLLRDDLRDTAQAASILSLVGQGSHRPSEIAGRLGKPITSLSRPLQRLVELGLIERETPFGVHHRAGQRALYKVADPFLRFWFRFVEPNRSRLEGRLVGEVAAVVRRGLAAHVGGVWEELSRACVPHLTLFDHRWGPASRWWGTGVDRCPMELDLVAESAEGDALLVGEVRWSREERADRLLDELRRKAENLPEARGRKVFCALWLRSPIDSTARPWITPAQVMRTLR
jgi:AAA+ ATPase superfamily predicted ATPase